MTDKPRHPADLPEQEITSETPEFAAELAARTIEPGAMENAAEEPSVVDSSSVTAAGAEDEPAEAEAEEPQPKLERLQKILAQAGIASRRHAEELITQGRVQVNGQTVTVLGSKADPERDHIRVDGKLLHGAERLRYFVLNKPRGYVTTVTDPEGRPTVMQFFARTGERLYPVGRLDYQSEGLLLVTNDGELANQLTRAASAVEKTYLVKVAGQPGEEQLDRLRGGVAIDKAGAGEGKVHTAPARIRQIRKGDNPWYEVVLIEGRNRELRKMFEEIGHHVEKIRRVGYGPLILDVPPGKMRELATEEVQALRLTAAGKLKPRRPKATHMLPKEAGQSTEQRLAKEAARRGKRFQRPYPRGPRRDDSGSRPPERRAGPKSDFRPDIRPGPGSRPQSEFRPEAGTRQGTKPGTEFRTKPKPDFRRPSRDDARTSSARSDTRFPAKPAFGDRPPRAEGEFRGQRPQAGAKPRFDRRPPGSESRFRDKGPQRGTGRPNIDGRSSDRPSSDRPIGERRPGFKPNRGSGFTPDRTSKRPDHRPRSGPDDRAAARPLAGGFSRPRLEIRPVKSGDTAYERPRGKSFDRERPRTGPRTDGPQRRNDSAPRFRGAGPGRPPGRPFGKGSSGSGKPGFSGRANRPAFGKPAFGSRAQDEGSARSQNTGPNRSPSRPQGTGDSPARFKKKDSGPRTNRSGPARGGKRPGGSRRPPGRGSKPGAKQGGKRNFGKRPK